MIVAAEGWTWLVNSTKWHYFRGGRSLCGRWPTAFARAEHEAKQHRCPEDAGE